MVFLRAAIALSAALTLPAIFLPGAIIIGLFLGVLPGQMIAFAPDLLALGLVALGGYAIFAPLGAPRRAAATAGLVGLCVLGLAACAFTVNRPARQAWRDLQAGDHGAGHAPFTPGNVAILADGRGSPAEGSLDGRQDDPALCGNLCQRLLYSGAATSVSLAAIGHYPTTAAMDPRMAVTRYAIARHLPCPPPAALAPAIAYQGLIAPDYPYYGQATLLGPQRRSIQDRMAAGDCLVSSPALLGASETVIILAAASPDGPMPGPWRLAAGPVSARRIAVFGRAGGNMTELYRHTMVWADFLCPVLAIAPRGFSPPMRGVARRRAYAVGAASHPIFTTTRSISSPRKPDSGSMRLSPAREHHRLRPAHARAAFHDQRETNPSCGETAARYPRG